jgi:hypothetical protein
VFGVEHLQFHNMIVDTASVPAGTRWRLSFPARPPVQLGGERVPHGLVELGRATASWQAEGG